MHISFLLNMENNKSFLAFSSQNIIMNNSKFNCGKYGWLGLNLLNMLYLSHQ